MINATKKWIFLKISSILLTPLMLWFAISLASFYDKNYDEVLLFFTEQPSKLLFSLMVIFAYFYSALSISEVFEDYIHEEKIKKCRKQIAVFICYNNPNINITFIV